MTPNNYRPISILPTISKLFERYISNQLQEYFNKYDVIHSTQSGFRQNHSCYTALTRLIDSWLKDVDSGKYVGTVYLDLKKAFDLVDHKILLLKLKLYHFTEKSIKFFESYLSNRKQKIKYKNLHSESRNIQSGVRQGSILGPLLFLIYINDIAFLQNNNSTDLFADDTTLSESSSNIAEIQHNLQNRLNLIQKWCDINNMTIHPDKSKCMLIATKQKLKRGSTLLLNIGNTQIENVEAQKLLGIYIDNTLSWTHQISYIRKRVNSKIALL